MKRKNLKEVEVKKECREVVRKKVQGHNCSLKKVLKNFHCKKEKNKNKVFQVESQYLKNNIKRLMKNMFKILKMKK